MMKERELRSQLLDSGHGTNNVNVVVNNGSNSNNSNNNNSSSQGSKVNNRNSCSDTGTTTTTISLHHHTHHHHNHTHHHHSHGHHFPEVLMEGDLILQALAGFLLILTCDGEVFYASHTVETYLGFHQVINFTVDCSNTIN